MVETEPIRISLEHKAFLDKMGSKKDSYDDLVGLLIELYKKYQNMNVAKIDEWGKAMISRKSKGKKIKYEIIDE